MVFQSAPSRGEGDLDLRADAHAQQVSIRALPWGGRLNGLVRIITPSSFNPRPPVGRATSALPAIAALRVFQSAPSRGEGDLVGQPVQLFLRVSIRALPWGGRPKTSAPRGRSRSFNPRPPVGRATRASWRAICSGSVSIRALPWGGRRPDAAPPHRALVSIRALPWGGRRALRSISGDVGSFNPRPPVGRATLTTRPRPSPAHVSIRALPWGGRLPWVPAPDRACGFQSAPSRGEGDSGRSSLRESRPSFNPRPPVGRATT